MSQLFTRDCNWRRSIGGWGQEQSDFDSQKVHAGSERELVLPPNTQLHVITIIQPWRMVYSFIPFYYEVCSFMSPKRRIGAREEERSIPEQWQGLCETDTWSLISMLSFFPLMSCRCLAFWAISFVFSFISILTFKGALQLAWPATEVTDLKLCVGVYINGCLFAGALVRNSNNWSG